MSSKTTKINKKVVKAWALVRDNKLQYADWDFLEIAEKKETLKKELRNHIYLKGAEIITVEIHYKTNLK